MTVALHLPTAAQDSPFRAISGLVDRLRSALADRLTAARRRRELVELASLSDRALRDIGLARGELLFLECASRRQLS